MGFTNFPHGITSFGVPVVGSGGMPITFGNYYFVDYDNGSDGNDGLSMDKAFKTVKKAYDTTVSNHNDVIVLSANSGHALTAMLTVSKNRVHFVGTGAFGRHYGARARITLGVTTAATDIAVMKNTGVGNSFTNIKFDTTNTLSQSLYSVVEAGEYALYQGCEIYNGAHLTTTGAAELVLNGDSAQFKNCTIGSLANYQTGTVIRACVLLTAALGGAGKVTRDSYFENCLFWKNSGHTTSAFVYSAAGTDVERMLMFNGCTFINAYNSAAVPAQAIATGSLTVGYIIAKNCTAVNCTKMSTSTGVIVDGPAPNNGTGIAVNAA